MENRKIQFIARACRWFDKVNGNTYHSVQITRTSDGATIAEQWQYGYGDQYRWTALDTMEKAGWLPEKYTGKHDNGSAKHCAFERENNYPIEWIVSDGLKRDMVKNGELN